MLGQIGMGIHELIHPREQKRFWFEDNQLHFGCPHLSPLSVKTIHTNFGSK